MFSRNEPIYPLMKHFSCADTMPPVGRERERGKEAEDCTVQASDRDPIRITQSILRLNQSGNGETLDHSRSYRSTDQRQEFLNCFLNNHGKKDNIILESVTKQYNHLRIASALKELKNPCRAGLLTCHDFNSIKSKSNQYLHLSDEEALSKPHQAADERLHGLLTH